MRKNTFWNRLFHHSEVIKNQQLKETDEFLRTSAPAFLVSIESANTLAELLDLHKKVYALGFTRNLGPCSYGMFRTKDISTMTLNDVYLGDIYGLFTKPASFWEKHRDAHYGCNGYGISEDASLYKIILTQYKNQLLSNIRASHQDAVKEIEILNTLNY